MAILEGLEEFIQHKTPCSEELLKDVETLLTASECRNQRNGEALYTVMRRTKQYYAGKVPSIIEELKALKSAKTSLEKKLKAAQCIMSFIEAARETLAESTFFHCESLNSLLDRTQKPKRKKN